MWSFWAAHHRVHREVWLTGAISFTVWLCSRPGPTLHLHIWLGGAQGARAKRQTHQTAVGQLVNWYGVLRTVVAATARDGLLKPLVVAHQKGWLKLGFGLLGGAQALSISQALPVESH